MATCASCVSGASSCSGACSSSCTYYCSSGGCKGCSGGCTGTCSGCSGGCEGCTGSCSSTCSGGCKGECKDNCTGQCKNTCQGNCNSGCTSSTQVENLANLTRSSIIYKSEIFKLHTFILNEAARRGNIPSSQIINQRQLIDDAQISTIINNLSLAEQDTSDLSAVAGSIATGNLIDLIITRAKAAYNTILVLG